MLCHSIPLTRERPLFTTDHRYPLVPGRDCHFEQAASQVYTKAPRFVLVQPEMEGRRQFSAIRAGIFKAWRSFDPMRFWGRALRRRFRGGAGGAVEPSLHQFPVSFGEHRRRRPSRPASRVISGPRKSFPLLSWRGSAAKPKSPWEYLAGFEPFGLRNSFRIKRLESYPGCHLPTDSPDEAVFPKPVHRQRRRMS
jgi:hypothetical protein